MATAFFLSLSLPSHTPFLSPAERAAHHRRLKTVHPSKQRRFSFRNGSTRSETDCPVPQEQQPLNEYHTLSSSFPFSWAASSDPIEVVSRLFATGVSFALLVGLPVSWFGSGFGSSEPEPLRLLLGSVSSGVFVTTLAVVRMYLGWAYVGNRLLSATVEYEETGWYDGQIWVKTPEVLTRDRLLGSFQVKPILNRLKNILIVQAAALLTCGLLIVDFETSQNAYGDSDVGDGRVVAGVYSEESARSFEPDAFCGPQPEPDS
ncbi:hypothetical protein V2J09_008013 [Rumex salicifolius]